MAMKLQLKVGAEAAKVEAVEGFAKYGGPTPPAGAYKAVIKQLQIKPVKSDPTRQKVVAIYEWEAPKGAENAEYNGFAVFDHLTLPESMEEEYADLKIGKINRLLDAIDPKLRQAFWGGAAVMDDKGEKILKIGTKITGGKGFKGFPVVVSTKSETYTKKSKGQDGKVVSEQIRTLRINDVYPGTHELPSTAPRASEEEVILDEDVIDDSIVDEAEAPEPEQAEAPEAAPEAEAPEPEYVDPDGDEDGYVPDEDVVEETPDEAPEPAPAETPRKRRSAF